MITLIFLAVHPAPRIVWIGDHEVFIINISIIINITIIIFLIIIIIITGIRD